MLLQRSSGVLCHITSLPSRYGIGDLGPETYAFVDHLAEMKQSYWQILPITPVDAGTGNSPYSGCSAFAGNVHLLSPDFLLRERLIVEADLQEHPHFDEKQVEFDKVYDFKMKLFEKVVNHFFERRADLKHDFDLFCKGQSQWLDSYVSFIAFKKIFASKPWYEWPDAVRLRQKDFALPYAEQLESYEQEERILQFLFFRQWYELKRYCNHKGIKLFGDVPIYVGLDSADVWAHPECFDLNAELRPQMVAGVPPDCFSSTGQLWGNPLYHWEHMEKSGFDWWTKRFQHHFDLHDVIRIDHFRGLIYYWAVPYSEATAMNGKWKKAPTHEFFTALSRRFSSLPLIAEDLGIITPDVREAMRSYQLPGMKVLLYAFGEDMPKNVYIPHLHEANSVVYTGTHDSDTVLGWYEHEADQETRKRISHYLGFEVTQKNAAETFIRMAMMSVSNLAIIPLQDLLGLGSESRMNRPGSSAGNWSWRLSPKPWIKNTSSTWRN